jgi:hypothetical protein
MHLYEIAAEHRAFARDVEDGLIPEEAIADTLECIEMAFVDKADSIACLIKNWEAEAAAIKAEEDALAQRRKARERQTERLRVYLHEQIAQIGLDKVETARNKITFRKNPPKVVVADEDAFITWAIANEKDYFLNFGKPTLNKTNLKEALSGGEVIPGAKMVSSVALQIK